MIDIGILGLDTSHPGEFADILARRDRATVSAVWDGGDVRDSEYRDQFCTEYDAVRYERPEAMRDEVDGVLVTTVDWGTHRDLAEPFLRDGTPVLIDKPIAGSTADIDAIVDAAEAGDAPLFGGSAVAFHPQLDGLATTSEPRTAFCVGYDHPFYYGTHLVDTLRRIVASNWADIEVNGAPGTSVDVTFEDGSHASLQFDGADRDATFGFLVTDAQHTHSLSIGSDEDELRRMYWAYLDAFLECIRAGRNERDRLVDAATMLLGVQAAMRTGATITPGHEALADLEIDGSAFLAQYRPY